MPNEDFDTARNATEELFEGAQDVNETETAPEEDAVAQNEQETQEPQENQEPMPDNAQADVQTDDTLSRAVETAEAAAMAVQEKDAQLNKVLEEINALKEQNQQLNDTIRQMSDMNKEEVVEEALEIPKLNLNDLTFADEETVKAASEEYAQKMAQYAMAQSMKKLEPYIQQAEEGKRERERTETLGILKSMPELDGIDNMMPQIEQIIANNKFLNDNNDMPIDEKYITAYFIAKGANSINKPVEEPKEPTAEELMRLYESNPEFQELLEKKRIDSLKDGQQVPPLSSSSGAVNAALNIKEKPKTFDEASERTRQMFGL